jgi:hypothetical protein
MINAVLVVIGLAVLPVIGWGAQSFFVSGEVPLLVRILVGIVIVGGVFLLGVVIRDRIIQAKKENLKGVEK